MAGGNLSWPDGGFKLDDVFLIKPGLAGQIVDDFLAIVGFFDSASWLGSIVGNSRNLLEVVVWSKATCASKTVAMKMIT